MIEAPFEFGDILPIIRLTDPLPDLNKQIRTACEEHGFFYLVEHGIPDNIQDRILEAAREFLVHAPAGVKEQVQRKSVEEGGDGARGYQVLKENVTQGRPDFHEAIDFYREWDDEDDHEIPVVTHGGPPMEGLPAHKFLHGPNLWPSYPDNLEQVMMQYVKDCKAIGTIIVKAMGEALGVGDVFVNSTRKSFWVMRMIGYPPLPRNIEPADGISCGEHTDYGCVTLLLTDDTPDTLQVQTKDGEWMTIPPMPGAFVVNIGDMMELWTNGLWKSTKHRVIHRSIGGISNHWSNDGQSSDSDDPRYNAPAYRISVPFFFEPNFDAVVEPLPECVERTGGTPLYAKKVYGQHLTDKVAEGSHLLVG